MFELKKQDSCAMSTTADEVLGQTRLLYGAFHIDHQEEPFIGTLVWRDKMTQHNKRHPFRSYVKLVLICIRLCKKSLNKLSRVLDEHESVMNEYDCMISWRGLAFRIQDFTAKKPHCLKMAARRLLEYEPEYRSEDDINLLMVALRQIKAFAEYPRKMQRLMCQVGRYECYQPRRVILRESDPPYAFYFILSGAVFVTEHEKVTGSLGAAVTLTKGMLFGELAVISKIKHPATVCSKTDVELLSIYGLEFENIIVAGGKDNMSSEKQRKFMRNVAFLRHWPIERLNGNCQTCTVYNFERNQVLVRDSNNSDWIYIVLKGSLSVIKKLKRMEPTKSRKRQTVSIGELAHGYLARKSRIGHVAPSHRNPYSRDDTALFSYQKLQSPSDELWTNSQETFKSRHELETKLEQSLPGYHDHTERFGSLDYNKIINDFYSRLASTGQEVEACFRHDPLHCIMKNVHPDTDVAGNTGSVCGNSMTAQGDSHMTTEASSIRSSIVLPNISQNNKVIQDGNNYKNVAIHVLS